MLDQNLCDLEITRIHDEDNTPLQTDDFINGDTPKNSVATKAIDELYTLITSFCYVLEMFFQPFYPREVTQDLHNDFFLLCQNLMFRVQENGMVYECLTVLVRVDS